MGSLNFQISFFFLLAYLFVHGNATTPNSQIVKESEVYITEFMAKTSGKDWIEIYNASNKAVDLNEWSLSDSKKKIGKYPLKGICLEPKSYVIISADGLKDTPGSVNFKLAASGGKIYLTDAEGNRVSQVL